MCTVRYTIQTLNLANELKSIERRKIMRTEIIKCDICQKEIKRGTKMEIPIIINGDSGIYLEMHSFDDVCDECLNELGRTMAAKYYEMCERHNSSGLRGITV